MAFSGNVSQQSVACSLEILSRLLAQIYLLKTRLWFVSVCAPGLWEFPEDESADRRFFQSAGNRARKENQFISPSHGVAVTATVQSQVPPARYKL